MMDLKVRILQPHNAAVHRGRKNDPL